MYLGTDVLGNAAWRYEKSWPDRVKRGRKTGEEQVLFLFITNTN
jgi:hypothetical protein